MKSTKAKGENWTMSFWSFKFGEGYCKNGRKSQLHCLLILGSVFNFSTGVGSQTQVKRDSRYEEKISICVALASLCLCSFSFEKGILESSTKFPVEGAKMVKF